MLMDIVCSWSHVSIGSYPAHTQSPLGPRNWVAVPEIKVPYTEGVDVEAEYLSARRGHIGIHPEQG